MLDMTTYKLPVATKATAPAVNGQGRPAFANLTKSQKAALGVAVIRGEASLRPTLGVVAAALDVSVTYIEYALKLSPEQLRLVRQGRLTLADTKPAATPKPRKPAVTLDDIATWWCSASEAEHAALIGRVGVVSTWDALEKNLV